MANMSYCRFQNTLADLRDCADNFDDAQSDDEKKARERLIKLCRKMVSNYWEDIFDQSITITEND